MSTEGVSTSPDVEVSSEGRSLSQFLAIPAIVAGLLVLGIGMVVVRDGTVPGWERGVFHAVNDLPDFLYRPLWPFQQLGALLIGPLVALVALLFRKYRLAIALLIATVAKLVSERLVKVGSTPQPPGAAVRADG